MLVQRGPVMLPPSGGGGGGPAPLPPESVDSEQSEQISQIVVDNFLEMNNSIEISMESSDNRIEDVMNGNMEDLKTEESLSSRDSFLTSSDNDDDDPPTLNESYPRSNMVVVSDQHENTFSSFISDCDDIMDKKDIFQVGGHNEKLTLSDSDVSSGEEGHGVNPLYDDKAYDDVDVGVTVHDDNNGQVKDHQHHHNVVDLSPEGGATESLMQPSSATATQETPTKDGVEQSDDATEFKEGEPDALAEYANNDLVTVTEETREDVEIQYEQKLTETFVEDVSVDLSESDVWNNGSSDTTEDLVDSASKLSPSKELVSDKLRNLELTAIQDKNVSSMIQRIESLSRSSSAAGNFVARPSLLDSPRLSHEISSSQSTPRAANRKLEIVVDSYEVQLEKSLELTTGYEAGAGGGSGGEGRGGIVKEAGGGAGADTPVRSSIHRVTFNTRNEVASEDTDGSLLVTYCPLEERIRRRRDRSPVPPGREPIKVKYVERNGGMTSSPRVIDFDDSTFVGDESQHDTSSDNEGWENPFQPEGNVSHDADLILRLWKGGNLNQDLDSAISQLRAEEERAEAERLVAAREELERRERLEAQAKKEKEEREEKEKAVTVTETTTNGVPVSNRTQNNQICLVNIDKQKHKNLLKKHCSLM